MRRAISVGFVVLAFAGAALGWARARAADEETAALREMTVLDRQNLEANLRWMLARERAAHARDVSGKKAPPARVGVFADAGCWHVSARSVADALEKTGVACRALDRTTLSTEGLAGLEALVLPGGWAPFQLGAAGDGGLAAIKVFAEKGGRVLGICAGGYLVSKSVVWEGKDFPYPLGLFDGTAQGPVTGFAPWPGRSPARMKVTKAGSARGLDGLSTRDILYYGGAAFVGGSGSTVLATYPDGGAAILVRPVGKGEVILSGGHLERPAPADGNDDAAPPAMSGPLLKGLLLLK